MRNCAVAALGRSPPVVAYANDAQKLMANELRTALPRLGRSPPVAAYANDAQKLIGNELRTALPRLGRSPPVLLRLAARHMKHDALSG